MVANVETRANENNDKILLVNGVLIAFMYDRGNHIEFVFRGTEQFEETEQYMTFEDYPKLLMDFDTHTALNLTAFIDICEDGTKEYCIQYCDYPEGYIYILEKDNTKDIETEQPVYKNIFEYKMDRTIYDSYKDMDIKKLLIEHHFAFHEYMNNIENMRCVNCSIENIDKKINKCCQEYCKRVKLCMEILEEKRIIQA